MNVGIKFFTTHALPVLVSDLISCLCSLAPCTPLAMLQTHHGSFWLHVSDKLLLTPQFNSFLRGPSYTNGRMLSVPFLETDFFIFQTSGDWIKVII